jgi:plastocyanin
MNLSSVSMLRTTLAAAIVAWSIAAHADTTHTVGQAKKAFTVAVLKAKVGDTVTFRNDDEFAHNVFSLSDTQSFDLGSYKKGEVRTVKLTAPGTIEVECAIHPEMKMKIEVQK